MEFNRGLRYIDDATRGMFHKGREISWQVKADLRRRSFFERGFQ